MRVISFLETVGLISDDKLDLINVTIYLSIFALVRANEITPYSVLLLFFALMATLARASLQGKSKRDQEKLNDKLSDIEQRLSRCESATTLQERRIF